MPFARRSRRAVLLRQPAPKERLPALSPPTLQSGLPRPRAAAVVVLVEVALDANAAVKVALPEAGTSPATESQRIV